MQNEYSRIIQERADHVFEVMAKRVSSEDMLRIRAAFELTRLEGIIPALESAHALGALDKMRFKPTDIVVLTVSGRGDKDIETYLKESSTRASLQ